MNLQMTYDLCNAEKALPARVKEYRRQPGRAGMIRKTDDDKSLIVPIARLETLARRDEEAD